MNNLEMDFNNLKSAYFCQSNVIAAFGNPILDISAVIQDETVLQKYNLNRDGQKEVNHDGFCDILALLKSNNYDMTYSPGGCAQNTLRIIQALTAYPTFCMLFGGLGDDEDGELLESELNKCGVDTRYAIQPGLHTGRGIALINSENRSLVVHLGAAEVYTMADFTVPDNIEALKEAYIAYIEGFFITHSFEVGMEAVKLSKAHGVVVVFNICGVYITKSHSKELIAIATAADIVIGNAHEFTALASILGVNSSSVDEIALKVHSLLWEENTAVECKLSHMSSFGKTVVITQGKDPVVCVCRDKRLVKFEIPYLDPKLIKDTTGAGDAFAAGCLVALIDGRSVTDCLRFGCIVAQHIIQQVGVKLTNSALK